MTSMLLSGLLAGLVATTAGQDLPRGQLVERVDSPSDPSQRYAVYLPTTHDRQQPAPLLLLMDPRGRARVPAELFMEAAERFGYVFLSSYNTASDGPIQPNLAALQAMWDDAHRLASIDDRRIYLVGFSGTARVACLVAGQLAGRFAGVVAAGAGFSPGQAPTREASFLYYGAIGDLDFNYWELLELEDHLVDLAWDHRIREYPGPHSWMPQTLATEAVEWLELRAMQSGLRPPDDALVETWWSRDFQAAMAAESDGQSLLAARRYGEMARDYAGLRSVSAVAHKAATLADTREAKRQLRDRQVEIRQTVRYMENAMRTLAEAYPPGTAQPERSFASVIAELDLPRLKREAAAGDGKAMWARRRLNDLGTQVSFYLPRDANEAGEYGRAAYYLQIATDINPSAPNLWYALAVAHARGRRDRDALDALERAVTAGFRDRPQLDREDAFSSMRESERYAAIVSRIGGAE